ncbi:Uncharacterized protein APZ42_029790 [Daphnia magna]|uniref:Uncharacterized protein n=1 Tax=Daphnia magna TaxID=35525 RepID=A0A162D479_9CRUS|nr:Uncharacterized protein APZ42_029790 [Daphnia magna]
MGMSAIIARHKFAVYDKSSWYNSFNLYYEAAPRRGNNVRYIFLMIMHFYLRFL